MSSFFISKGERMYYTYIIRCEDNTLYTGMAKDLEARMLEHYHRTEKCAKYTMRHHMKKLEMAWTSADRSLASKLEYNIKHLSKSQKEDLLINFDLKKYLEDKIDVKEYSKISASEVKKIAKMLK